MAQFDVYLVRTGGLVIDCQSDVMRSLPTRFVVPLRPCDESVMGRLTPIVEIEGKEFAMFTPLAGAIDARDLERPVASLIEHEYLIKSALDMLISGY